MIREFPVTAVQEALHRRWRLLIPVYILLAIIVLIGIVGAILVLILLWQLAQNRTPHYADIIEEFKYGSIGTEPHSGIPYRIWRALPTLFPEDFAGRQDYSAFGFVYESDAERPSTRAADRHFAPYLSRRRHSLVQLRHLPYRHRKRHHV